MLYTDRCFMSMLYTDRCFMSSVLYADGYLMAYLPGHFTHLLNVDVDLDLSHHIMYRGMLCYCSVCMYRLLFQHTHMLSKHIY